MLVVPSWTLPFAAYALENHAGKQNKTRSHGWNQHHVEKCHGIIPFVSNNLPKNAAVTTPELPPAMQSTLPAQPQSARGQHANPTPSQAQPWTLPRQL